LIDVRARLRRLMLMWFEVRFGNAFKLAGSPDKTSRQALQRFLYGYHLDVK
jgi:hypothetical protein